MFHSSRALSLSDGRVGGLDFRNRSMEAQRDSQQAVALFDVVAALSIQHAGCSAIEIAIKSTRNGPNLAIRDNGSGFDPEDVIGVRRGLGLLSMEHYAAQSGLVLSISRNRGGGTVVRAKARGAS